MADSSGNDQAAQFVNITGAPRELAEQLLSSNHGDLQAALTTYYAAQDEDTNDSDYVDDETPANQSASGGHRMNDSAAATSSSSNPTASSLSKPSSSGKKFATLGDVTSSNNDGDDSDDDDKPQNFFAGGEKSGLAVQNPDDLKKRILEKANRTGPPPKDAPQKKSHFKGAAQTLGSDDTPSQPIAATPQAAAPPERVERILHFWTDGFSVDDGDLYRSDDPANAGLLDQIRRGHAPLRIMNVAPGQEIDVELKEHKEKYVKPKKKYKPFDGGGNRLGSPTPAATGVQSMPGSFDTTPAVANTQAATPSAPTDAFDESQPSVTIRVSLGSGTRLTSRFNTTQTVGDIYEFVRRAEAGGREFVMQTTFPTMELKNMSQQLGDMPEFKRGGAVVQKFV